MYRELQDLLNEQFIQMEALENKDNYPNFIENFINVFLSDQSPKDIKLIEQAL